MESLLTLKELLSAVNGTLASKMEECIFTSVETDSRNVKKDTLFVPLIGEFQDGHKYIPQAIEKGASVVFVDEYVFGTVPMYKKMILRYPYVSFILVKNTLHALQDAAEAYVNKVCRNMIKISITGSCGKTTTKEMMVSVCKQHFGNEFVAYTKGNFNSETGLPLSVFCIKGTEKVGIFEMGMNRVNEIGEISKVFKSQYGIITNIGTAHIGILGSRENIASEKRKSLSYIPETGAAFVPSDDDFADYCTENVKGKIVKFGLNIPEIESKVKFVKDDGLFGTVFTVEGVEIHLPISGMYNYQNGLGVIACALEIGITATEIKAGLESVGSVSGRMEVKRTVVNNKSVTLIDDCYNANPDSMKKSIELVSNLENVNKKILILADMKELGEESEKEHKAIGQFVNNLNSDVIYLIGPEIQVAKDFICNKQLYCFEEKSESVFDEIVKTIEETIESNDVILLKGSHSMELNKIVSKLEKQGEAK